MWQKQQASSISWRGLAEAGAGAGAEVTEAGAELQLLAYSFRLSCS